MSDTGTWIAIISCLVIILVGVGFWFVILRKQTEKSPKHGVGMNTKHKSTEEVEAIQALYVPQEIGQRTGQKRIFSTSKGLRAMDVNQYGLPMPEPTN